MKIKKSPKNSQGFITSIFDRCINLLLFVSLIEIIKKAYIKRKGWSEKTRRQVNIIIDLYICLKWVMILVFWLVPQDSNVLTVIVVYLIMMNLTTYFYHHFWSQRINNKPTQQRLRRRFVSLMQAFLFSCYAFAYLYYKPFSWGIDFDPSINNSLASFVFSLSNSFFVDTTAASIIDARISIPIVLQHFSTFVFGTIIISKTLSEESN